MEQALLCWIASEFLKAEVLLARARLSWLQLEMACLLCSASERCFVWTFASYLFLCPFLRRQGVMRVIVAPGAVAVSALGCPRTVLWFVLQEFFEQVLGLLWFIGVWEASG